MQAIANFIRSIALQSNDRQEPKSVKELSVKADELFTTKKYDEALKFYAKSLNICLQQPDNICNQALKIYQNTTLSVKSDRNTAIPQCSILVATI